MTCDGCVFLSLNLKIDSILRVCHKELLVVWASFRNAYKNIWHLCLPKYREISNENFIVTLMVIKILNANYLEQQLKLRLHTTLCHKLKNEIISKHGRGAYRLMMRLINKQLSTERRTHWKPKTKRSVTYLPKEIVGDRMTITVYPSST